MSRCFPFPPPGYERQTRADDIDLLKKEKHREKKHKREKKDREKREDKEKREKDSSEGKHRDKKDKKEKRRDKKKDDERERDKNGTSDERKLSQADVNSKEKSIEKDRLSSHSGGPSGEKFIQETEKEKIKNHTHEKRAAGPVAAYGAEKNIQKYQNNHLENSSDKFVQELGKRVRDEGGIGKQFSERFSGADRKREGAVLQTMEMGTLLDRKVKNNERRADDRKLGERELKEEKKLIGNAVVQNVGGAVQSMVGVPRPGEKNVDKRMEGRQKIKGREGDNTGWDKQGVLDMHQIKSQRKDRDREKEKKKEDRLKKSETKKPEQEKVKDSKQDNANTTPNIVGPHPENTNKVNPIGSGVNLKKRKDSEPNGFSHETLQKLPRPTSTSHSLIENGRILDPFQNPSKIFSDGQEPPSKLKRIFSDSREPPGNLKVDSKEHKVNGILDPKKNPISSTSLLTEKSLEDSLAEASVRPPHPDSKYLNELLRVPKLDDLPELERDEEWLFGNRSEQLKKSDAGSPKVEDDATWIWDKAVHLASADIVALPYVVPF